MSTPPSSAQPPLRIRELRDIKRRNHDLLRSQQHESIVGTMLSELFDLESSGSSSNSIELEPATKKGPGVQHGTEPKIEPWLHQYHPLIDPDLVQDEELDKPAINSMCPYGKGGHGRVAKVLGRSFKHLDDYHLMQTRAAVKQFHLCSYRECKLPENHPPHIQRHVTFSVFSQGTSK